MYSIHHQVYLDNQRGHCHPQVNPKTRLQAPTQGREQTRSRNNSLDLLKPISQPQSQLLIQDGHHPSSTQDVPLFLLAHHKRALQQLHHHGHHLPQALPLLYNVTQPPPASRMHSKDGKHYLRIGRASLLIGYESSKRTLKKFADSL